MTVRDSEVDRAGALPVAVLADVLDRLGHRGQVASHRLRPVTDRDALVGRAFTIRAVESDEERENPYEHEIAAVDALPAGSVVVMATGGCYDAAVWGELLCTRALARGALGAVVDGAVRDLGALRELGLPTFAASVSANDSAGRVAVVSYGEAVVCGGVDVSPGDLVVGDADGVVVVPADAAAAALDAAEAKRTAEEVVRRELAGGASVADAYSRHGVL